MRNDRLKKLQTILQNSLLIKKKENLLYLTGRSFMQGYLLVKPKTRINTDTNVVFLGDGLEKVDGIKSDFLKNVGKYIGPKETLEVFGEFTYAEIHYIKKKNPELKIKVSVKHGPADHGRMIKELGEIALVKKSMQVVERVFFQVKRKLGSAGPRPAITEIALAEYIKQAGLKLGAEDVSFPPIVASGANAAVPHHVPSSKRLKPGEPVILDFGYKYKNYCSDFTRTVFLKSAPKKLAEAYNQVEKAYNQSIDFINRLQAKGARAGDIYQHAVDVLAKKHLDKYFIHSLGHGTGLEIHELPNLSPRSKDVLKDGMVFSIEPGVYLPKVGGIRIEDLVYLDKGECKKFINVQTNLTNNIIK